MQFKGPPLTPAHNLVLGDGFAPPHMPANPMQHPNAMTPPGMQLGLGQGTATARIHQVRLVFHVRFPDAVAYVYCRLTSASLPQNTLPHTMPAGALPRSSNQPQDPMIAPFAEDLDPEISSMALHTNLQAATEAQFSGLNTNAIRAAWLAGQSGRRETPR